MANRSFQFFNFFLITIILLSSIFLIYSYKLILSKFIQNYLYILIVICCLLFFLIYKNLISKVLLINFLAIYLIIIFVQEIEIRGDYTWSTLVKVDIERRSGNDTYPPVKAATWLLEIPLPTLNDQEFFPLSDPSFSNITLCREKNGWQSYQTDRYGFRNNDEIWDESSIDNLFIGDSFTVGYCVPKESHFIYTFEKNGKTLRLGNQTGPLTALGVFLEYIVSQEIHVVRIFWVFTENDIYNANDKRAADIDVELESTILTRYLNGEIQNLAMNQEIISKILKKTILEEISDIDWSVRSPKEYAFAKRFTGLYFALKAEEFISFRLLNQPLTNSSEYPAPNKNISDEFRLDIFDKTLAKVRNYALKNNTELYMLFLPSEGQLESNYPHPLKSEVMNVAENNNFNIIDFEPIFRNSDQELKELFGTGHYSIIGYSLITNELQRIFKLNSS